MSEPAESRPRTLVFHKLLDRLSFGVTNYSPDRFDRLLQWLQVNGWHFTSPGNGDMSGRGRGIIVSFDDGYAHISTILPPVMEKYSFQPLVFVPTALLGKTNSWDYTHLLCKTPHLQPSELRRLAAEGVTFGSHGGTHRDLTSCSLSELKRELADSRKILQDLVGQEVKMISYPFGRWDRRVVEEAREAGFRLGFTMHLPRIDDSPMSLGRVPVYSYDTFWSINRKLEPGLVYPLEHFKTETVNRLSGGTIWLNRLRRFRP